MYLQNVKNCIDPLSLYYDILKIEKSPYSNSCYITFAEKGSKGGEAGEIDYRLRISDHTNRGGLSYNHVFSIYSEDGTYILNKLKMKQLIDNCNKYKKIGMGKTAWIRENYLKIVTLKDIGTFQFSNQIDEFV